MLFAKDVVALVERGLVARKSAAARLSDHVERRGRQARISGGAIIVELLLMAVAHGLDTFTA